MSSVRYGEGKESVVRFHFFGDQITLIPLFFSCDFLGPFLCLVVYKVRLFPQNSFGQGGACILFWCSVYNFIKYSILFTLSSHRDFIMYSVDTSSAYRGPGGSDIMISLPATEREDTKSLNTATRQ